MAKRANNKYSTEADDMFGGGDMGGGMDMGGGGMDMGGGFGGGSTMGTEPSKGNGLLPQDNVIVRGMKRLRKLLGVSFPKDLPKLTKEKRINLFAYTPNELKYQPGFAKDGVYSEYPNSGDSVNLYDYLNKTVQQSAS